LTFTSPRARTSAAGGTGRKQRITPLTALTVAVLRVWPAERNGPPDSPLFPTQRGTQVSRDGLERRLTKHLSTASRRCPSIREKNITLHTLRHRRDAAGTRCPDQLPQCFLHTFPGARPPARSPARPVRCYPRRLLLRSLPDRRERSQPERTRPEGPPSHQSSTNLGTTSSSNPPGTRKAKSAITTLTTPPTIEPATRLTVPPTGCTGGSAVLAR
jgi:hypothetical protein